MSVLDRLRGRNPAVQMRVNAIRLAHHEHRPNPAWAGGPRQDYCYEPGCGRVIPGLALRHRLASMADPTGTDRP